MAGNLAWLGPLLGAFIAAVGGGWIAARKASGRIQHTEANKLWDEATSLREVYQGEIARLRMEIERLDDELEVGEQALKNTQSENEDLARENARLHRRLDTIENHAAR